MRVHAWAALRLAVNDEWPEQTIVFTEDLPSVLDGDADSFSDFLKT